MSVQKRTSAFAIVVAATCSILLVSTLRAGQTTASGPNASKPDAAKKPAPPRLPDGHPDLQGIWSFATATPLQRPKELAGKAVLTDQEAADFERKLGAGGCRIIKCDGSAQAAVDTA